jgi:hypothetical protein
LNKVIDCPIAKIKIHIPNYNIKEQSNYSYNKQKVYCNYLFAIDDTSRILGYVTVKDNTYYPYSPTSIDELLKIEEDFNKEGKKVYKQISREILFKKGIKIGFSNYIVYSQSRNQHLLIGHIIFIKNNYLNGIINLKQIIENPNDIFINEPNCIYRNLEFY